MRGLPEKRLLEIIEHTPFLDISELLEECTELEPPWLPIDEDTPKDKPLLLYYPDGVSAERNVLIGYAFEHNGMNRKKPTHWQEPPKDPE